MNVLLCQKIRNCPETLDGLASLCFGRNKRNLRLPSTNGGFSNCLEGVVVVRVRVVVVVVVVVVIVGVIIVNSCSNSGSSSRGSSSR